MCNGTYNSGVIPNEMQDSTFVKRPRLHKLHSSEQQA